MVKSLKIYSFSKCGTCRKALKWLQEREIDYKLIDIIANPPNKKTIIEGINQLGDIKFLLNTSGKSYREIGASAIKEMNDDKIIQLLLDDPKLLKRPFAITEEGEILIGFSQPKWEELLLSNH